MNLGQVESGPTWDRKVLKLQYTSGQACPDGSRNKSSVIRFKCDKDKVVRRRLQEDANNRFHFLSVGFVCDTVHTSWTHSPSGE